jgi:glycosyltransferase involved in cell wall biosynthesis
VKTVDIVLPVYNEEEGVGVFHAALLGALAPLTGRYHFRQIYVLDRSRDRSLDVLRGLAAGSPDVTVLHLSRRFGHQMSLVAGIDYATGDAIVMMDCDLQHPPAVIAELLDRFEQGFDIVQTVRRYHGRVGLAKRATSKLFYHVQNALSPVEIKEGFADFRLISQHVATVFREGVREQNQFLRGLFQWVGFHRTEVEFVSPPRVSGTTKYRPLRLLAFAVTGIVSFSKLPLRIATVMGFALATLSAVYGCWLLVKYFSGGGFPPGYASLILVVLVTGGLQLMFLGIVGEYLGQIFDEVKRRPLYVVDEVIGGGGRV